MVLTQLGQDRDSTDRCFGAPGIGLDEAHPATAQGIFQITVVSPRGLEADPIRAMALDEGHQEKEGVIKL